MTKIKLALVFFTILFIPVVVAAQSSSDYLILHDIGPYKISTPRKSTIPGYGLIGGPRIDDSPGVLKGADHFPDHTDKSCEVMYLGGGGVNASPTVEVTQHAGGDSDRWLLHEIEDLFRSSKIERLGLLTQGSRVVEVSGNKIMARTGYRWVSNNIVINISYTDLDGTKAEPLEVVQAYLTKFPSTITITDTVFKSSDYNIKWIKDEIDRRLWLCEKWNAQFQAGKTTQKDLLYNLVSNMEVFLNYRQKYFGDINARDELTALYELQKNNDIASIQTKLSEYKGWWNANKAQSISLP